jgi:hypothetical protein
MDEGSEIRDQTVDIKLSSLLEIVEEYRHWQRVLAEEKVKAEKSGQLLTNSPAQHRVSTFDYMFDVLQLPVNKETTVSL